MSRSLNIRQAAIAGPVARRLNGADLPGWLSPVLFLALWWSVARVGVFPSQILVSPEAVIRAFAELAVSGELGRHISASAGRLSGGFVLGVLAALAFGCAAALSRTADAMLAPLFTVLRTIPSIAFIPILILLFGIGETFKILVVTKATFFPVALATREAVRGIPTRLLDVARVYRLPMHVRVTHVVLPAALPSIVTGIRLGLGRSWGVLVGAELVAADAGIGQMMEFGRQMFRLDQVMVGVILAGLIGFGLDYGLRRMEAYLSRWRSA